MFYKIYKRQQGIMLAVCDENICGKTLGKNFFVNPRFYKEEVGDKNKIKELLKKCFSANLVGKEAVACGVEIGLVEEDKVVVIDKVPHAIAVVMTI